MRMQAVLNGTVIAESDETIVVEGNHYFPLSSVRPEALRESSTQTNCHWKGVASYYSVTAGDATSRDAAWYYAEPKAEAAQIKGRVAFWKDVKVRTATGDAAPVIDEEFVEGRFC